MISIDGSELEGGGQVVRGAVALSALTGKPVRIYNIRKNRPKPGLAAQHIAAVRAVAGTCEARCEGLSLRSCELTFTPGRIRAGKIMVDVGTAGSIPLVLQAWLPVALRCGGRITVIGGTEVQKSPSIDYCEQLVFALLKRQGADIALDIRERGYFPRGGGEVRVNVNKRELRPFDLTEAASSPAGIISCSSNLPAHVTERQAKAAGDALNICPGLLPANLDQREGPGTGSSCTVWCGWKGGVALGKRGLPAERVGQIAAKQLIRQMNLPGAVDEFFADQLIIYLALYGGKFTTGTLSLHARTMLWLLSEFGFNMNITEYDNGMTEVSA